MVHSRPEVERQVFTRHKKILVVDGECGLVAVVGSFFQRFLLSNRRTAQQKHDQQQLLHCRFPFSVDREEEAFPSYLKNAGKWGTCREFSTTEDAGDTEVIARN